MRFWDTSALVPLIVEEERSDECRAVMLRDRAVVVWAFTELEAFARIYRDSKQHGKLSDAEAKEAERRLALAARTWRRVGEIDAVVARFKVISRGHGLKAADCLQLAAALEWAKGYPKGKGFVAADGPLVEAADRDGFAVTAIDKPHGA